MCEVEAEAEEDDEHIVKAIAWKEWRQMLSASAMYVLSNCS